MLEPGNYYHIYNRANGFENLFRRKDNYYHLLRKYQEHISSIAETYCYCLMPNHIHFFIKVFDYDQLKNDIQNKYKDNPNSRYYIPRARPLNLRGLKDLEGLSGGGGAGVEDVATDDGLINNAVNKKMDQFGNNDDRTNNKSTNLDSNNNRTDNSEETIISRYISQQFSNLFNAYSKAYNKQQKRHGSLFQARFKRKNVDSEEYFRSLILYIHNNPVHHCFTDDLNQWDYSSYHFFNGKKSMDNCPIKLQSNQAIKWFGTKENFIYSHEKRNNTSFDDRVAIE